MERHFYKHISVSMAAVGCGFFALLLYVLTVAPTFGWGDSADLAMRMVYAGDTTFVGSHRDYGFYRWVGGIFQLLPWGDAGWRANVMSAFCGAVVVGLVSFISGYVARHAVAAVAAGVSLAVSHTFWLMSAIAEVYTFNAVWVFGCYAFAVVWWRTGRVGCLIGGALCTGLALAHHASGLVLAATVAPLVVMRMRDVPLWGVVIAALVAVAASFSYWQLVWEHVQAGQGVVRALGLEKPGNPFFDAAPLREGLKFLAYVIYNYLGLGAVLAVAGMVAVWRARVWEMLPLGLWMLLMVGAGVTSSIPDKFNIYVLVYPVIAVCVGIGMVWGMGRFRVKELWVAAVLVALALVPPAGYAAAIVGTQALGVDVVGARQVPYRDNAWYFMWPSKRGDEGPRRFAEEALLAVEKDAVVIVDYSLWRPLYFVQAVEGMRPDVNVVWVERLMRKNTVAEYIGNVPCERPVYLASNTPPHYYQLAEVEKRFTVRPVGVVFEVERGCGE